MSTGKAPHSRLDTLPRSARFAVALAHDEAKQLSVALEESQMAVDIYEDRIGELEDQLELAERRAAEAEVALAEVLKESKGTRTMSASPIRQADVLRRCDGSKL